MILSLTLICFYITNKQTNKQIKKILFLLKQEEKRKSEKKCREEIKVYLLFILIRIKISETLK